MSKQSSLMILANRMANEIVANQTFVRLQVGFDAATIAAHEVFQMGPGRAAAFREAYNAAADKLATLIIDDAKKNHDKKIDYAKGKRDELIKKIVGEENFVPFDIAYGSAYIDELMRIRVSHELSEGGGK